MLEDLTCISSSAVEVVEFGTAARLPLLLPLSFSSEDTGDLLGVSMLLLLLERFRGKMDLGSVKDVAFLFPGDKREAAATEAGCVGVVGGKPRRVLTNKELLNPDKNGLKFPPNAATTAAYWNKTMKIEKFL